MLAPVENSDTSPRVFSLCIKEASFAFAAMLYHVESLSPAFRKKYMQDVSVEFGNVVKRAVNPNKKTDCLEIFDATEVMPWEIAIKHYDDQDGVVRLGYALTAMKNAACKEENREAFLLAQDGFFLDRGTARQFRKVRRDVVERVDVTANSVMSRFVSLVKKDPDISKIQEVTLDMFRTNDPFKPLLSRKDVLTYQINKEEDAAFVVLEAEAKTQGLEKDALNKKKEELSKQFADQLAAEDRLIVPDAVDIAAFVSYVRPSVEKLQTAHNHLRAA